MPHVPALTPAFTRPKDHIKVHVQLILKEHCLEVRFPPPLLLREGQVAQSAQAPLCTPLTSLAPHSSQLAQELYKCVSHIPLGSACASHPGVTRWASTAADEHAACLRKAPSNQPEAARSYCIVAGASSRECGAQGW